MHTVVIIPTYNEAENITTIIPRVLSSVPNVWILVVDDNSPDGTALKVEEIMRSEKRVGLLNRNRKEGLGKAYVHAFDEVLKDHSIEYLVMMDADHSHDPKYLPSMLEAVEQADMVTGSRYIEGGETEGWEVWRKMLSTYGNTYCRIITGMPINDATAGFNVIRTSTLRRADIRRLNLSGYAFQMELKYLLWKSGARCIEVPIVFKNRKEGESKISNHIIREGLIAPWKMRFRK